MFQSFVPTGHAPAANTPRSSAPPVPSSPAPPASGGACLPSRPPSPSRKSGFPGHCTTRKIHLRSRSLRATPPSPCGSIPPPPVAHSRSRWSRRPESRSGHANDHRSATDVCSRRYATPSRASGAGDVSAGAFPAYAVWPPARLLAARFVPTYSSPGSRALRGAFHENAACSGRSTSPDIGAATLPSSPAGSAWGRFPLPPVGQPDVSVLFQSLPPATHRPVANPYNFSRGPPGNLLGHGLQQHVLNFHHPLHLGG